MRADKEGEARSTPGRQRQYTGAMARIVTVIGVIMALYHLLYILHIFERLGIYILAPSFAAGSLGFILMLVFLLIPMTRGAPRDKLPWYDIIFASLSAVTAGYVFFLGKEMAIRDAFTEILPIDLVMGSVMIFLIFEATRRVIGPVLPSVATAFILHAMFCSYIPGLFHGKGFSWGDIVKQLFVWNGGIFSIPMHVAATIVIAFIIFAQFLQTSGAGKFFIDVAFSLFGRFRGGPAKVAILASALFGTLSGSTSGNVASTGVITIPMMKQIGFKPHFAGAVEAVSSNGGQLMPPVMGAVAFVMCEFLEIPYVRVCAAALIPALLYFLAVFIMVDLESVKLGLRGLPRKELPSFRKVMREGWCYLIPLVVLIYLLAVLLYAPETAVLYALGSLFIVSIFKKGTRLGPNKIIHALEFGSRGMLEVGTACATAGIIIGCIGLSGLGQKLSMGLIDIAGGSSLLLLILTAIASFVLGMGMTSIPIYIMLVILVAPALTKSGVLPIAAHLFVFYWGLVSFITPPVCIAAFVAAAIAGSKPFQTGWEATRLGIVSFIIPFMFVYGPALLLEGSGEEVALAVATAIVGVAALAAGLAGYVLRPANWLERMLLIGGAMLLIFVGWMTDVIGTGVITMVAINQIKGKKRLLNTAHVPTNSASRGERR